MSFALVWLEGEIKTPPFTQEGRIEAGVLLPNTKANIRAFQPGTRMRFASGTERRIVRLHEVSHFLWITLEGDPLDPDSEGFPHRLEIVI